MKNPSFWSNVLRDGEGQPSSMRLMSLLAFVVAVLLSVIPAIASIFGKEINCDPIHVIYFLTAAFAPKAFQKFAEKKNKS